MMFEFFFKPFLIAFSVSTGLLWLFLSCTRFFPQWQRWRSRWIRFGGIAIILGFLAALLGDDRIVFSLPIFGLLISVAVIMGFGIWDDLLVLSWKAQVFFQVLLGILVFLFGVRILFFTNPFGGVIHFPGDFALLIGFCISLFWFVLLMNALNWLDGSDGLCGGVSLIALLTIFFLALKPEVSQPAFAILAAGGAGAVAGFLLFNFPPARIFAGTSGSMFLGFLLAFLATAAGTKMATALLVLVVPIADALYVIGERFFFGASIFEGDKRHLHYKLSQLGWSSGRITWAFLLCTSIIALLAFETRAESKFLTLIVIFPLAFLVSFLVSRRVRRMPGMIEKEKDKV